MPGKYSVQNLKTLPWGWGTKAAMRSNNQGQNGRGQRKVVQSGECWVCKGCIMGRNITYLGTWKLTGGLKAERERGDSKEGDGGESRAGPPRAR